MAELIDCWKHGVKVLPTTKCTHFEEGQTCGDHPNCFFKTRVARWQYLTSKKHSQAGEVDDEVEENQAVNVDDAFW